MTLTTTHPLDRYLKPRIRDANISSTSLVFTFFCDVVTQHGGEIWLGSIIHAMAPLGISERLVRTAVFRLQQDGWLMSHKRGRRSYYHLTPTGLNFYQRAADRIYACNKPDRENTWTLVITSMVSKEKLDTLKRGLTWQGFGRLAAGVYALPGERQASLNELLDDLDIHDSIVTMQAHADDTKGLHKLVLSRWNIDDLRHKYRGFNRHYRQVLKTLTSNKPTDGHSLLLLRVILIHEYRRILLADPELPAAMLPPRWEGFAARSLTGEIYSELIGQTTQWVSQEMHNAEGRMKPDPAASENRFETHSMTRPFAGTEICT
jgi:phenylacetic acid degradation operon negative regulatory protein